VSDFVGRRVLTAVQFINEVGPASSRSASADGVDAAAAAASDDDDDHHDDDVSDKAARKTRKFL